MLGAIVIVAVSVPLVLLKQGDGFNFGDFGKSLQSSSKPKDAPVAVAPKAPANIAANTGDSAGYVEALDQAARKLSAEISKSPSDPALQNRLGYIYMTLGDSKSAEQCFTNAVSLSRSAIASHVDAVEKLRSAGKMKDASSVVLEASKANAELSAAHANLARVFDQRGDRQAVIAELDQINKDGMLFNGFSAAGGKLKSKDGMLSTQDAQQLARAEGLFKANQMPAALQEFRKLAEANPKLAFVYDRIGLISVMTGDVGSGIQAWEKAVQLNPNSAGIRSNLGLAYHQVGMDREAEQAFKKALALDPTMEEAALNLGELLSARGELAEATAVMQESAKRSPNSARAANNLGTFLSLSGHNTEAISSFHKAIRIDPSMASAHYGMGVALLKTRKFVPAARELKIALALNPKMQEAQAKLEEAQKMSGGRG